MKLGCDWILDVDLRKFFDTIDQGHLREFLKRQVRDGVMLRSIGKWLNAGVLEEWVLTIPNDGTPQGGMISSPTMLRIGSFRAPAKRERADFVFNSDGALPDLYSPH